MSHAAPNPPGVPRALAGEVERLSDETLAYMLRNFYPSVSWGAALTELIAARKEIERLTARVAELEKERDACAEDAATLRAALERIARIRPVSLEMFPDCYSKMRGLALDVLAGTPSSGATP